MTYRIHTLGSLAMAALCLALCRSGPMNRLPRSPKRSTRSWSSCSARAAIRGLPSYGTGFLVSPDGYILTVNSHILDTGDLRVHTVRRHALPRQAGRHRAGAGRRPAQDRHRQGQGRELPYFDVVEAAKRPIAEPGTGVLALQQPVPDRHARRADVGAARRDRGLLPKLYGRIGIFEAPYTGNVYVIDAITNNPGAAGGAITTRKGELLGIIGKELRNELTNTWINYAMPINATVDVRSSMATRA